MSGKARGSKIEVSEETGLACWATYLINGDASGISDDDQQDADAFVKFCGGCVVSIVEGSERFGRYWGPGKAGGLGCDLVTYIVHIYGATS